MTAVVVPIDSIRMPGASKRGSGADSVGAQLGSFIDESRVLTRMIDRIAFASDASLYRLIPRAVVQPVNSEEVRKLFQFSRERKIPLTFRAGGTSLCGQAITDGILVDIGRYWRMGAVEENGRSVRVQPGLIGQQANQMLKQYATKIGPDPASISAARMGGILSNNASGMCCGVSQNAYHTLRSMTFVLPSGTEIDTALLDADIRFRESEPRLAAGLLELKQQVEANSELSGRIRAKYRMKNTTGYSLNAFLDYSDPVEIFSHLLIGSEGTLAFIAEAVLETVPDLPVKYTGLLLFPDLHAACEAIAPLREAGAAALELMDCASLRSVEHKPGIPAEIRELPNNAAALLVEFQTADRNAAQENADRAQTAVQGLKLLSEAHFTDDPVAQDRLWSIRKGLFPSVGAVRAAGTTVIIEDVAFPVDRLADAAVDLIHLFEKHHYDNAIIFGHAKDGNLHFVITQGFNTEREVAQYRDFMADLVRLVVQKYDGALKAEHGTGRNMAPFVETEWGPEAYAMMRKLKALADPDDLLNPGVILNSDPEAHLADLKKMPVVEAEVDKCIECGYCEPKCPSRDLTLTPRQRIVVRREMQRLKDSGASSAAQNDLGADFQYMALDTCAVDGLCATACPVNIDTGTLTKRFRRLRHTAFANRVAAGLAQNFTLVEAGGRLALAAGHLVQEVCGLPSMRGITRLLDKATRSMMDEPFWQWSAEMPGARRGSLPIRTPTEPDAVYFPACISRIMGAHPGEQPEISVMQAMLNVADRAGVKMYVPGDIAGNCCGVPFSSKGFETAHSAAVNHTVENFFRWSKEGRLPIVIDTSPCTYGLKTARPYLNAENQVRFDALTILDSVEFAHDQLLPKLPIYRKVHSVAVHPVCSAVKMAITPKLVRISNACSDSVYVSPDAGCCAFAGDRGFLFPELTASATDVEARQVREEEHDGYYSSSRTCEIGLTRATGKVYQSYLQLLEYASRSGRDSEAD
ncbi:FAD-binding and (Fe-S)-binding domain-containing protein [Granulicella sp. L46]|uniref:FAD-binding and (Fe-S)-binding domain-containing protein n=1 Tax=Granulicella sp. L46 TaxID=1641865 RepID=UPI0020B163F6|nr:FAD-binding and (Fe-S)-binding domain-containing protein [Granulicella sp. L46]